MALESRLSRDAPRPKAMQMLVDVLWSSFRESGVSWVGFYLKAAGDELILGPRRDKPACSPIGMHGACGKAFLSRRPLVVRDVADLGAGYIACDPRDQSELVLPLFEPNGACWGVLDLDSHEIGTFTRDDVEGLSRLLTIAGLTAPVPE